MRALLTCALAIGLASAAQQDATGEKLKAAKTAFEADLAKYKKAVGEYFDRRDQAARNNLDKKLVAQIKSERDAFDERGDLPKDAENLIALGRDAQKPLEAAFEEAATAYFKAKMDEKAAAVEKELPELLLKNKRANHLADLKYTKAKSIKDVGIGRAPISIKDVAFDQAVIMHPGRGAPSEATYALAKGYTSFRSKVVVYRPPEGTWKAPGSHTVFEVLANGKSLWKSKPVAAYFETQECTAELKGVENVILRVSCSGDHTGCHAYWLDPILVR